MRGLAVAAIVGAAALAAAVAATAQYTLPVTKLTGSVTPKASGSGKPRTTTVRAAFTVSRQSRGSADRIVFMLPRGVRLSGRGFRACSARRINNEGEGSCPGGTEVGSGVLRMRAGAEQTPLQFAITAHAAGRSAVALLLRGPKTRAVTARIGSAGSGFGQKLTVDVPADFRQPLPGLHANVAAMSLRLGARVRRRGRTSHFARVTGCPDGASHRFGVRVRFRATPEEPQTTTDEAYDTSPCRR